MSKRPSPPPRERRPFPLLEGDRDGVARLGAHRDYDRYSVARGGSGWNREVDLVEADTATRLSGEYYSGGYTSQGHDWLCGGTSAGRGGSAPDHPYITWAGGLLGPLLSSLVIAVVLKFLADTVMGAGIGFKKTLAVVTYARLPSLLSAGLSILVMYLKPADEFDLSNPLMVNAAAFLPAASATWMKALGAAFDLFTFWSMALMAIGFAAAAKRMSTGKAFGMILVPWALYVILSVGGAAAFRR